MKNRIFLVFLLLFSLNFAFAKDFKVVREEFLNEENPKIAISIYAEFLKSATDLNEVYLVYRDLAYLYNLLGEVEKAQLFFERASYTVPTNPDFKMLANSVGLLLLMNRLEHAQKQLDILLIRCKDIDVLMKSYYFSSYICFFNDDIDKIVFYIDKMISLNVKDNCLDKYLRWIAFICNKYPSNCKNIVEVLKMNGYSLKKFDFYSTLSSPLSYLTGSVDFYNEEEIVTPVVEEEKKYIIAGSYSKKELADNFSNKLIAEGFATKVEKVRVNSKNYFRLYVLPIENDYDKTLLLLKKFGYEAFIINVK